MITVNSLSGGKTSSYMACNYKTDYNVFSLVCIEDKNCKPKDAYLIKYVSEKLQKDFIASVESDKTIKAVLEIEQKIGKKINWVCGPTFEKVIEKSKFLPNVMMRFCTSEMKMKPIFEFCQNEIKEVVKMNIGFRFDEKERAERNKNNTHFKTIIGKTKNGNQNKWGKVYWRELNFPLVENKITNYEVIKWSKQSGLIFPEDSNCVGCFHKPIQQLRKNWEDEPEKMAWFANMEKQTKGRFKKEMSYSDIKKVGLQKSFYFGTGSGCNAGFCTD